MKCHQCPKSPSYFCRDKFIFVCLDHKNSCSNNPETLKNEIDISEQEIEECKLILNRRFIQIQDFKEKLKSEFKKVIIKLEADLMKIIQDLDNLGEKCHRLFTTNKFSPSIKDLLIKEVEKNLEVILPAIEINKKYNVDDLLAYEERFPNFKSLNDKISYLKMKNIKEFCEFFNGKKELIKDIKFSFDAKKAFVCKNY